MDKNVIYLLGGNLQGLLHLGSHIMGLAEAHVRFQKERNVHHSIASVVSRFDFFHTDK
ncbi:hypothetical protein D3C81_2042280 [compost metagenome]